MTDGGTTAGRRGLWIGLAAAALFTLAARDTTYAAPGPALVSPAMSHSFLAAPASSASAWQARPLTQVLCVSAAGGATGSPCTNATAYTTIQTALDLAASGDEIRIAGGTFTGSGSAVATIAVPVVITGGYAGGTSGWSTSNNATSTIVDGQGARKGFIVQGAIAVAIQNLTVVNGGIQNDSGTVTVGTGPLAAGRINLNNGGTTNGTFFLSSGSDVRFAQGTQVLANGTRFTGGGAGFIEGGTVTIGTGVGQMVSAENFMLYSGTLTGSGTFSVTSTLLWNGGTMDSPAPSPGVTNIASTATALLQGNASRKDLTNRTLNNYGTFNMSSTGGSGTLYMNNGAVFNNGSASVTNAAFNFQNDDSVLYGSGSLPTFHNYGSLRKLTTTGISILGSGNVGFMQVMNDGSITANTGILSLDSDSTDTGLFGSLAGARLRFNGGNHNLQNSTISATGDLEVSAGIVTHSGAYSVSGTTYVTGSGILELNGTVNMAALVVRDNGSLRGNAVVTISGVTDWTGGWWYGPGITRITTTGVLNIRGVNATHYLDGRTVENYGTTNMNGTGNGVLYFRNGASFTNEPGANFNFLNNDSAIYQSGDAPHFVNLGTINKTGGAGTPSSPPFTRLGSEFMTFENRVGGTVNVMTGTLSLDGGNTNVQLEGHGGAFVVGDSGATLRFNSTFNTTRFLLTSSINGIGNLEVAAGTVNVAGTYSMSGPGETRVLNGTLNFDTNASSRNVTLAGGTIGTSANSGPFTLTVAGLFRWNGGTMAGATNQTVLASTGTLTFGGVNSNKTLSGRTFNNNGTAVMNGTGTGTFFINDGGVFNNNANATFDIQVNDSIRNNGSLASQFNNAGTLSKTGGAAVSVLGSSNLAFNNANVVNVMTGTLSLEGGTTNCTGCGHTGSFFVDSLTTLRFGGGTHTLQPTSSITGPGSVEFAAGTVDLGGTYDVSGTTRITAGTANFNHAADTVDGLMTGGTLGGSASFDVSGLFTWNAGTMSGATTGNPTTNIASGATLRLNGVSGQRTLSRRTLNNSGTIVLDGTGTGVLNVNDGATLNNNAGALFDIQNNDSVRYTAGTASLFNNSGLLTKSSGAGTSTIGNGNLSFNNAGAVSAMTGTLSFDGGGTDTGSFSIDPIANVRFGGGTHNLQATSSITGTGSVLFNSGTVNLAGTYVISGTTSVTGGVANFVSEGTSLNTGLTSGSISGSGTFTTTGTLQWNGGTMEGLGITVLARDANMYVQGVGASKYLVQRAFNNLGTVSLSGTGQGNFYLANGANFINASGAFFNIQNNDNIAHSGGSAVVFRNDGTFSRAAGSGAATVSTNSNFTFINQGLVEASSGVLVFTGGYTQQNAGVTRLNGGDGDGGDIRTTGTINVLDGSIAGTGAITSTILNTGGQLSPGGTTGGQTYGTINLYGNYTMGNAGSVSLDIGGAPNSPDFDQIHVSGTAALSGTLNVSTASGFTPTVGDVYRVMTYTTHTLDFSQFVGLYIGNGLAYQPSASGTAYNLTVQAGQASPTPTATGSRTPAPTFTPTGTPPTATPTVTPGGCTINFSDVTPDQWFYQYVEYLFCHGAISGYADGTFRPYANTTRGQLSKIVVLAEGWAVNNPPVATFRDVPVGSTFFPYIETAYGHNIISGYSCGTGCLEFRPFNNVTRAQLSKIVVSAQGWSLISPPNPTFSDVPFNDPFYTYIETASAHQIISGYADGTFRPGNQATRAQICKIVYLAVVGH